MIKTNVFHFTQTLGVWLDGGGELSRWSLISFSVAESSKAKLHNLDRYVSQKVPFSTSCHCYIHILCYPTPFLLLLDAYIHTYINYSHCIILHTVHMFHCSCRYNFRYLHFRSRFRTPRLSCHCLAHIHARIKSSRWHRVGILYVFRILDFKRRSDIPPS